MKPAIIFSLGGSLIVPDQIDIQFLKKFNKLIHSYLETFEQIIIVTGGGKTARNYQNAASEIGDIAPEDLDWLGIHASHLNAHLVKTIMKEHADEHLIISEDRLTDRKAKIVVAGGFTPGNSTDLVAVKCAEAYGIKTVINLSNIDYVYDLDPRKFDHAKPLKKVNWKDFQGIVGDKWIPGANVPFDPIATKLAKKLLLSVVIMKGSNLKNLENYLDGKEFEGTVVS